MDSTEGIKQNKMEEGASVLPRFAHKMRTHFWNIHQFFCDLVCRKIQSELKSLKEFNTEELESLKKRIRHEIEDSKLEINILAQKIKIPFFTLIDFLR